jgi:hypothetical protein
MTLSESCHDKRISRAAGKLRQGWLYTTWIMRYYPAELPHFVTISFISTLLGYVRINEKVLRNCMVKGV